MDRLIYVPKNEYIDNQGTIRVELPLNAFNPNHPDIPAEVRRFLLGHRFFGDYLADGLQTGHVQLVNGVATFTSKIPVESYIGFALEAYVVRKMTESPNFMKRNVFLWCSKRDLAKDNYVSQFVPIGTGLQSTKTSYPRLFIPGDVADIRFVRTRYNRKTHEAYFETLPVMGTNNPAGVQLKSITGNEMQEIIQPLISGKYSHVITMLPRFKRDNVLHSHDECMRILDELQKTHFLSYHERLRYQEAIKRPSQLGFDEDEIRDYVRYMYDCYPNFPDPGPWTVAVANLEIRRVRKPDTIVSTDELTQNIIIES